MLFVVVTVIMLYSIVVLSLLVWALRFLLSPGPLAPPYHLNKATNTTYARRCGNGLDCGFYCVLLSSSSSAAYWDLGAALSFKPLLFIVIIFINIIQTPDMLCVVDILMLIMYVVHSLLQ